MKILLLIMICLSCSTSFAIKNEGQYSPVFSPDGKFIAYHINTESLFWDIIIENIATGEKRQITNNKFYDTTASWSPSGNQLTFSSDRTGQRDIYLYDLISEKTFPLIEHPAMDNQASYSPSGQRLAFLSRRDGQSQLYLYDFSTKKTSRLSYTEHHIFHPSWSDDGKKITFDQRINEKSAIYSITIKSGKVDKLYENGHGTISSKLRGTTLFLSTNQSGNWDIIKYDLLTKIEQPVIFTEANEMKADIHQATNKLVYSKADQEGKYRVEISSYE